MATIVTPAYDSAGTPLTGLTPSWYCIFNAVTEVAYTPAPAISPVGGGLYKFNQPTGVDLTGIIDLGGTASPRYMVVTAERSVTFAAFDSAPTPLPLLTVVWSSIFDVEGNAYTPQPTIIELGLGMYKIDSHIGRAAGFLDLTSAANPQYAAYDSDDAPAIVVAVTPDEPIALTALSERVVESDLAGDLELGPNNELVLSATDGDLVLVTGMKGIGQACKLAILAFKGEWFADLDEGVPWYDEILGQKREEARTRTAMRDALLGVDGVVKIEKLQLDWDGPTRTLSVAWEVTAVSGQTVSGSTTL